MNRDNDNSGIGASIMVVIAFMAGAAIPRIVNTICDVISKCRPSNQKIKKGK